MNFVIWLIAGGTIGWLASVMAEAIDPPGKILNVAMGVVGAVLGGWLVSPLVGVGRIDPGEFSLPAMLVSFMGAAMLLAVVNHVRRDGAR